MCTISAGDVNTGEIVLTLGWGDGRWKYSILKLVGVPPGGGRALHGARDLQDYRSLQQRAIKRYNHE